MRRAALWSIFTSVAAACGVIYVFIHLFGFDYSLPLCAALMLGSAGALTLFCRRERRLSALIWLALALTAASCALLLLAGTAGNPIVLGALLCAALLLTQYMTAGILLGLEKPRATVLADTLFLALVFHAVACWRETPAASWGWLLLLAFLAALAGAAAERAGEGRELSVGPAAGGIALSALAAALCLALALGLTAHFSESARALARAAARGIWTALTALGRVLERFFVWFFSLFPTPEALPEETVGSGAAPAASEAEELAASSPLLLTVLLVLLAAALLALLFALLRRAGRFRLKTAALVGGAGVSRRIRRQRPLAGAFRRLAAALRFRFLAFRHRNTPAGLLLRLERRASRAGIPRRRGESCRAFVCRLAPDGCLDPLADAFDRQFYGLTPPDLSDFDGKSLYKFYRDGNYLPGKG